MWVWIQISFHSSPSFHCSSYPSSLTMCSIVTCDGIPSGKLTQLRKITMFNGKIHYKWQFSIAMLNYQRVTIEAFATKFASKPSRSPGATDCSQQHGRRWSVHSSPVGIETSDFGREKPREMCLKKTKNVSELA